MAELHDIMREDELPNLPMLKMQVFSRWGAKNYVDVFGYKEGWFMNVNYGEKWLYVEDHAGEGAQITTHDSSTIPSVYT